MFARSGLYRDDRTAPGIAILPTVLAFNALGESLRVALDPTMKLR